MPGSFATTSIITNGLHCGPACTGLITSRFSLYCDVVTIPPIDPPTPTGSGGGGGYYPGAVQNRVTIQDFYQPTNDQYHEIPLDREADYLRKHINVTIKLALGDINIEKTYRVPDKRKGVVVRLFDVLNATQQQYNATITKLKVIVNKASITIRNLKARK